MIAKIISGCAAGVGAACHVYPVDHTGTGGMVKIMLDAGLPVRWVAAPGSMFVDLIEMPRPS